MKKTLALVLALALVSALCGMLFVSADDANLASGLTTYTLSQQFRQGGKEVNWGWDDNAPIAYPDDAGDLTDGKLPEEMGYGDPAWIGFHPNAPEYQEIGYSSIVLDLGKACDISKINGIFATQMLANGIATPTSVEYLVSDDGENFTSVGTVTPTNPADVGTENVALDCDVTGQYVMVKMVGNGWMFIAELEVYGAEAATAPESSEEAPESSEEAAESSEEAAESSEAPAESKPEESKPQTGDAGILVFAVLGVVAIAGVAVAVKARG